MRAVLAVLVLITVAVAPAAAHVTPSVDDNNRYAKLTLLGDRVRVAYTVFFGDNPGRLERAAIDTNHDGTISEDEAHAFGARISGQVAEAIDLDIDGKAFRLAWAEVDVGMGAPEVAAGAFSIDLVAYPCLPVARGPHELRLRDRFRVSRPGSTEVKVEDSPGVSIQRARVGAADDPSYDYTFVGPGGPLEDDGLDVAFTVGDKAPIPDDARCTGAPADGAGNHGLVVGVALGGGAVAAAAILLVGRRGRGRRKPRHG